jgi:hypothetical protein
LSKAAIAATRGRKRIVGVEAQLFDQKIGVVRSYRRKSEIFREEDPANRVYEFITGRAD